MTRVIDSSGNVKYVDVPTGVTAGTYGDAGHVAQVTVDETGRVTSVSDVAITPGSVAAFTWHNVGDVGEPAFQNSWANYDTANYSRARFTKGVQDLVYLTGLIKSGTVPAVIFTLPTGYRPTRAQHFSIAANGAFGYARVDANGDVVAAGGSNTWFDLSGIVFPTD